MQQIEQVLNFMMEIEKLKDIHRKTRPVGLKRYENSAEHSWHVCISALMLKDYANADINIDRVIKMLLIHDLGEIDAGDTIIYQSETVENKQDEENGVKRLLDMLPDNQGAQYLELWQEFELGESEDAQYARAIDRVPPLLHNINDDGHTWKKHNITKDKVFDINSRIGKGSTDLWEVIKSKLNKVVDDGLLK